MTVAAYCTHLVCASPDSSRPLSHGKVPGEMEKEREREREREGVLLDVWFKVSLVVSARILLYHNMSKFFIYGI